MALFATNSMIILLSCLQLVARCAKIGAFPLTLIALNWKNDIIANKWVTEYNIDIFLLIYLLGE